MILDFLVTPPTPNHPHPSPLLYSAAFRPFAARGTSANSCAVGSQTQVIRSIGWGGAYKGGAVGDSAAPSRRDNDTWATLTPRI